MTELVSESGIDACPSALAVPYIFSYIAEHPELIEHWLRWSENKRVSSGWYFTRRSEGYSVGCRPNGKILNIVHPEVACAEFIVHEIRTMMVLPSAKNSNADIAREQ